jgi:hypothetical protein
MSVELADRGDASLVADRTRPACGRLNTPLKTAKHTAMGAWPQPTGVRGGRVGIGGWVGPVGP